MAAGAGEVQALMKGSLHTDVLLHAVMQKEVKLRTGHQLSHCAMVSVPTYARRVVISDVALNTRRGCYDMRGSAESIAGIGSEIRIRNSPWTAAGQDRGASDGSESK